MSSEKTITTGQIARRYDVPAWLVRQVIDRHVTTAGRVGPYRVVAEADLPTIEKHLQAAGYLAEAAAPAVV